MGNLASRVLLYGTADLFRGKTGRANYENHYAIIDAMLAESELEFVQILAQLQQATPVRFSRDGGYTFDLHGQIMLAYYGLASGYAVVQKPNLWAALLLLLGLAEGELDEEDLRLVTLFFIGRNRAAYETKFGASFPELIENILKPGHPDAFLKEILCIIVDIVQLGIDIIVSVPSGSTKEFNLNHIEPHVTRSRKRLLLLMPTLSQCLPVVGVVGATVNKNSSTQEVGLPPLVPALTFTVSIMTKSIFYLKSA